MNDEIKIDEMTSVIDGVHDIVENTHFEAPTMDTSAISNKSSIGYMAIGAAAVGAGAAAWHFGKKAVKALRQKLKNKKEAKEVDSDNEDNFNDDNKSDKE